MSTIKSPRKNRSLSPHPFFRDPPVRSLSFDAVGYRHLHCDWRTSRFKFSRNMERAVKMPLQPGRGLMDWIRLCQQNPDMGGNGGQPKRVTESDMAEHGEKENAWMIVNGKVYNVGPYMEYHPGGVEQLMRAAGTDGTKLFNEKHPWVNYESMLKSCLVGNFVGSISKLKPPGKEPLYPNKMTLTVPGSTGLLSFPGQIQYPKTLIDLGINCSWKEDGDSVQMLLDTPWRNLSVEEAVVECISRRKIRVLFRTAEPQSEITWTLPFDIQASSVKVKTSATTPGRLSVSFQKEDAAIIWPEFLQNCVVRSVNERKYRPCRINRIETVTHDTRLFTIDFPTGDAQPIPVGSHVFIRLTMSKSGERPFTPVMASLSVAPNAVHPTSVNFLIKMYPQGAFTPKLWTLKEGDSLDLSDHQGSFSLNRFSDCSHIFLLAAGTGFTPMARIIQWCLHELKKKITLLFFNKTEEDILWREDLENIGDQSDQFHVINILSNAEDGWSGRKGRVSVELLGEFLLPKSSSKFVCVCGPNGFVENSLLYLRELQYDDENVHVFQG